MADRSQKALSEFVSEAQETIDALGKDLMRLEGHGGEHDPDLLNAVFRAAHSLKGISSMFGVERMARLAHALEDLLDDVRMGRRPLDRAGMDLALEVPELFSTIIAEESTGAPPATLERATQLTERLRAADAPAAQASEDALDAVALEPELRRVLTDYEEHRLRSNVQKGVPLFRVRVNFELGRFDKDLADLNARLKAVGEVISTLPASDERDPSAIAFDLLLASREPLQTVILEAGPAAAVGPVARRGAPSELLPPLPSVLPPVLPPAHPEPPPPAPRLAAHPGPAGGPLADPPVDEAVPVPAAVSLSPQPEALHELESSSLRSASQAVRVDIHKLDRLMNVVGELVLVKTSLLAVADRLKVEGGDPVLTAELHRANRSLERKLDELQGGILEVRMVPLDQVFDKLSRLVRKLSRESGKVVEFEVSGGDVELDKLIVEDLSDPLMHLIRNAIDHAVEPPEVRTRLGKPRAGRITLTASHRGNHVRIVVEDDGAGIDEERVREVAVARGLASAEAVAGMSRRDVLNLIFLPGFSTARQVTALSGRGVGMDVVKNNIANLSGIIDLQTEKGKGTRFEITLPVTLAIIRALVVSVAGRIYAVPLNSVLEILEVHASELRTVSTREVLTLRGATLPITRLARHFALEGDRPADPFFVVVVGLVQERLGIAVDDLVGQQDIVVKPLGRTLHGVRGIAGATDLGGQRTVLVLDVGAIIEDVVKGQLSRETAV